MSRLPVHAYLAVAALAVLGFGLVGCGGGDESSAAEETDAVVETEATVTTTVTNDDTEAETTEADTGGSAESGPAPAPGMGSLELDDGRVFAITVTQCEPASDGSPTAGSMEVRGTSETGSTFDMTQFFLNGDWSQSDASLEFPNRDQIYVLAFAAGGAEPATIAGKSISWTQTFRELDESANSHVWTGEGTLRITCP